MKSLHVLVRTHSVLYFRGTLGIDEIEVSSGCRLLFGLTGKIAGSGWTSPEGILRVPTLTVADGGEVTVPPGLTDDQNSLTLEVFILCSFRALFHVLET